MRKKLSRRGSKRLFKATANRIKTVNMLATPMRGGFRL